MYNFNDTIITEVSDGLLPSEALKINNEYIENLISGYRTLTVSGREALSPEIVTETTGIRDGSIMKSKRYPERIIIVKYQLITDSPEAFREAYTKLAYILDVEDAELIFNDEQDKFFIGTPYAIGEVEAGRTSLVGEFEILCVDPFKYSIIEYEAEPDLDNGSILIDYGGTYKSFPTLEAEFFNEEDVAADGETAGTLTGSGDCGYVAFFTEDAKIIQLGDPDETDGETVTEKSQALFNQTFKESTSWGTTAQNLWTKNSGSVLPSTVQQVGSYAMKVASYGTTTVAKDTSGTLLKATSTANAPTFNYTVIAKATNRTSTSVKVTAAITAALGRDSSYFGKGYGLNVSLYIGGAWHTKTIKATNVRWEGKTGHTVNITVTVSGLSNSTTALTGIKFKATRTDSLGTAGTLGETACNNLAISAYGTNEADTYFLTASSYGTASGKWHGPSITKTLPADSAGIVGAVNFTMSWKQRMSLDKNNTTKQLGAFQVQVTTADGTHIAGVRIVKGKAGKTADLIYYVNGTQVYKGSVDLSYNNKYFGNKGYNVSTSTIVKSGEKVTINVAGVKKTFTNSAIADLRTTKVTYAIEQYSSNTPLSYNGFYWFRFVKDNSTSLKDIPNKFTANDVVQADCKDGEIYLNGTRNPSLGALGNDWEHFYLTPGLNQIGVAFSDWVEEGYEPNFKVKYREVFL